MCSIQAFALLAFLRGEAGDDKVAALLEKAGERDAPVHMKEIRVREEWETVRGLRSQIAILKTGRGQHRKFLPYAFTEPGAIIAANVLNSPQSDEPQRQRSHPTPLVTECQPPGESELPGWRPSYPLKVHSRVPTRVAQVARGGLARVARLGARAGSETGSTVASAHPPSAGVRPRIAKRFGLAATAVMETAEFEGRAHASRTEFFHERLS